MLVLSFLIFLLFQEQVHVESIETTSWFDQFIAPYESIGKFDAFVFSYFTKNSSSIQTAVRGRCYSLAGANTGAPNPAVSLFRIGSVTKLFTATAIFQLYEKGLIDLNAPITNYVPSLSSIITSDMKVIDTLRHTTGVDERVLNVYISGSTGIQESLTEASRRLWTQQLVSPGSRISYSNLGVTIMGAVVENVSQMTLSKYLQENIVKPLNLSVLKFHNDFNGNFTNVCYPRSGLHYEPYQVRTTSSGDIYTTLIDISKFLSSHLNDGYGLFQYPSTAELMHSRLYPKAFDGMAHIFQRQKFRNRTILSKDGGIWDFFCNAALYPDYNEGVFAASTEGPNPTDDFLEEILMFQFVTDNYNKSIQPEFPFSVDSHVKLSSIQGVYIASRGGQKSPIKLFYLLNSLVIQVSDQSVVATGVTYQAALNVPGLFPEQLLLMANTSTSPDNKNQFMLVTFTDSSKTTVLQIEQFPDLNTLQPVINWYNRKILVLVLFGFALVAQLLAAFLFPAIGLCVLCKRRSFSRLHLMGLSLTLICWTSIGFFISIAVTPYPIIFFNVQPGFIGVQASAICLSAVTFLWTLLIFICWFKKNSCSHRGLLDSFSSMVNDDELESENRSCSLFPPQMKRASKAFLILWVTIIVFQIIGIPGFYALNLLSFTIW